MTEIDTGGPGTIWLSSLIDPRWNWSARVPRLVVTAGRHPAATARIDELTQRYGTPPADLTYSCWKE